MRPINRIAAPNVYKHWGDARNDLAAAFGWYCSYCEMSVTNMLEVEHVVPRSHGGDPLNWNNLLLSCKYCNTIKLNNNRSRDGYVWPDRDNSDLAFKYSEHNVIEPTISIIENEAEESIRLMGLNRRPGGLNRPTEADSRWLLRIEAWRIAKLSLANWRKVPIPEMAEQIALTALGTGFYSIWVTVFAGIPEVLTEIKMKFPNTYNDLDLAGIRIVRAGGII